MQPGNPQARSTKTEARISFVYFDLDDTLLDHRKAEKATLADCQEHFAGHLSGHSLAHIQETYDRLNATLWRDYGAGIITKSDLKRLRFERLLTALEVNTIAPDVLGEHYLNRYAHHWSWIEGAEAAFHAIADRFPVGILTNGFKKIQHAKLDRFPSLRERAASIVISEEVGVMKPNSALFAHAEEKARVPPEEILYIGDSLHSDVEGGRNAGWQVAWFRGESDLRSDVHVFEDWGDLIAHLL
ncbi:MAG: HAD-IA family hydrolase [Bacteroidetes bacterium]|nr:HAD-IA family hydrolase [Bacteroidota bacterium]